MKVAQGRGWQMLCHTLSVNVCIRFLFSWKE